MLCNNVCHFSFASKNDLSYFMFCWGLRVSRSARPQQHPPQAWHQDPDRPSIVSATELKELDNLDNDTDEGWAGLYIIFREHQCLIDHLNILPSLPLSRSSDGGGLH